MAFSNYRSPFPPLPPIVRNLIILNIVVYLAQLVTGGNANPASIDLFALHHYKSEYFRPHQLITHMFMHGDFYHLLFNMFSLFIFGSALERTWEPKRFLIYYFLCGIGAAAFQLGNYMFTFRHIDQVVLNAADAEQYQLILRRAVTVGASGAIMGLLVAFGYLFPNREMIIFPLPTPLKAKWVILGIIALDIFGGIQRLPKDNVAH